MFNSNDKKAFNAYVAPEVETVDAELAGIICDSINSGNINWFGNDGDDLNC